MFIWPVNSHSHHGRQVTWFNHVFKFTKLLIIYISFSSLVTDHFTSDNSKPIDSEMLFWLWLCSVVTLLSYLPSFSLFAEHLTCTLFMFLRFVFWIVCLVFNKENLHLHPNLQSVYEKTMLIMDTAGVSKHLHVQAVNGGCTIRDQRSCWKPAPCIQRKYNFWSCSQPGFHSS